MSRHAFVDQLIIGVDGILQSNAPRTQLLDRLADIICCKRQMLDTLAMILADEFFDLALVVLTFVKRDTDRPIRGNHGLAEEPGRLSFYVEIFLLLEIEERAVELAPYPHMPAPDIVRQVIEHIEAHIVGGLCPPPSGELRPILIKIFAVPDEVQVRSANPLNDGIILLGRLRAMFKRPSHRRFGIGHAKGHGAGRWAMLAAKRRHPPGIVPVQHQVDATLFIPRDVLGRMPMRRNKTQLFELRRHRIGVWRCKFDKFKSVQAQWIVSHVRHLFPLILHNPAFPG